MMKIKLASIADGEEINCGMEWGEVMRRSSLNRPEVVNNAECTGC